MKDFNSYKRISEKLAKLGATEYQYFSDEGKVRWRNSDEEVVAYADCMAIMSYASTNNSYRWGLFPDTPTIEKPGWTENMVFDVTEEQTREIALKTALEKDADFMFAGNWVTLTIYLACNDIVFENDNINNESAPWHPIVGDMNEYADIVNAIMDII